MKGIVLFEDEGFANFLPLLLWRTVFELRPGRDIILDRTAQQLALPVVGVWTRDWIAPVARHRCGAAVNRALAPDALLINGRWLCEGPVSFPAAPAVGMAGTEVAYIVCDQKLSEQLAPGDLLSAERRKLALTGVPRTVAPGEMLRYPWDIVRRLPRTLEADWKPRDAVVEEPLDPRVTVENPERVHIGLHTRVHPTAVLDASAGPVYLSENVRVGPYSVIEGPVYIGPGSQINPHAWLHGPNAIGPVCKLGGEIVGCVIHGYTNKQHHGFLGHCYVGSWVNFGAGTSNSDLKNTYGSVRVSLHGTVVDTGLLFCGGVIGDHVKTAINATLPTGVVLGMAAVINTSRVVPKFVPSFGWVTDAAVNRGDPARLLDVAVKVMSRRHVDITDEEVELMLDLGTRAFALEQRR
ncbi:MAG TPA: putative sugar nucleotidyl transferase [Phycisphaerae bacterium]|nr:putative sugar nucleotidyl transferase [Phycisphaerae bacterium]HNU45474.1 putative sugar nucleotidyl transferase [Phycisphaerae bacterium]